MVLGEHLRANRIFYGEIDEESSEMLVEREFVCEGTPRAVGKYPMEVFAWLRSSPQKFEPTVVKDVRTSQLLPDTDRATLATVQAGAFIAVPLIKDGRLVACLCATDSLPRDWTEDEVELVTHTGERTWAAVERARSESALREGEERFRLFLENVREYALVQLDPELRFTSWNPGAERIFGYSSEEALGKPFSLLLSPEDIEAQVLVRGDIKPGKQRPPGRCALARSQGWNADLGAVGNRADSQQGGTGYRIGEGAARRDRRLKTEASLRQSEKLAVVGRMASSIAHEINNPLEAVTNLIYLARRGVVSRRWPNSGAGGARAGPRDHITTATLSFHRQTTEPAPRGY